MHYFLNSLVKKQNEINSLTVYDDFVRIVFVKDVKREKNEEK